MFYALARPLLFALEPETAHALALKLSGVSALLASRPPACPVRAMGLDFLNPVGLAAGLDKQAEHVDALAALGFGFLELGGVTPRPQPGNPRPRMFRLPEARGIINRFGLNSVGIDAFVANLARCRKRCVLGVNIGKNKDTPNEGAADDYLRCLEALYPHVDYVSLNVSSPNTPGLRDLQDAGTLAALLAAIRRRREILRDKHGRNVALALKIAPDLDDDQIDAIAQKLEAHRIDAVIATNTTVSREAVMGMRHGKESGGLSGAPLREMSNRVIRALRARMPAGYPIIGAGGVMSGADACAKIDAGATLVQVYTGLVYRGPALVRECALALRAHCAGKR